MEKSAPVENPNMEPKMSSVFFFISEMDGTASGGVPSVEGTRGLHVEPHLQAACSLDVFRIFQTVCYNSWHVPGVAPQSGL